MSQISERGFEDADARAYADAAVRGRTLILADVSEETADRALSIMDRVVAARRGAEGSAVGSVPIVEEELSVSKAKSVTGGARVTTSVSERPVEETVTLRTETVEAKYHSADRVLGAEEAEAAFEGKTVEMMGTQEEVEVHKEARVVGEVALNQGDLGAPGDRPRHGPQDRGRGRAGRRRRQRHEEVGPTLPEGRLTRAPFSHGSGFRGQEGLGRSARTRSAGYVGGVARAWGCCASPQCASGAQPPDAGKPRRPFIRPCCHRKRQCCRPSTLHSWPAAAARG